VTDTQVVRVLAGRDSVPMAVRALASLARRSDRPLAFVVHDDGTLDERDRERLREAIPGTAVVNRPEADALIDPRLDRFPACRAFRRANPLALKLLDLPLLADGDAVAICDTDVLALRPFSGMFEWPGADTTAVFMPDSQNAYALRPWHLLGARGVSLPCGINTGLMLFRRTAHDLEFVEWFLARAFAVYRRIPNWVEQTAWAALANRGRCRLYDARQVRVVESAACVTDSGLLVGHFTSSVRHLWPAAEPNGGAADGPPIAVRTRPAQPLGAVRLAIEQGRRAAWRGQRWIRARFADAAVS
jgi:hypothetical protein